MPKVKSEKRTDASAAPYEKNGSPAKEEKEVKEVKEASAAGNGDDDAAVGVVPTAGFRDGEHARKTLAALKERDATYQFQVINSLQRRAKTILSRTKDPEKVNNLTEAIKEFDDWLNDFKAHNRSREQFNYLPLETMEAYIPLAERYELKRDFLQVFHDIKGDSRQLRTTKVQSEGDEEPITWDIKRNRHLKELTGRVNKEYLPLFEFDPPLRGLPTSEHCEMIMWGYSPEPAKVKKCISQLAEKLKADQ